MRVLNETEKLNRHAAMRRRNSPRDWTIWPTGARSVLWRCGHTYTCSADETEDGGPKACPTCYELRREAKAAEAATAEEAVAT